MTTPALSEAEISEQMNGLNGWERSGDTITKTFKFDHYLAGLAFATAVGTVCEGMDHHPDITVGWRKVTLSFTTHDAGSKLSTKDFQAARLIDSLGYPKA